GWEAVEAPVRSRAVETLARGTVYGTLTVEREGAGPTVRVNEAVLNAVLTTLKSLAARVEAEPPRLDGILGLKGVIEVTDEDEVEADRSAAEKAVILGFERTVMDLAAMRGREGEALKAVLAQRLSEIAALSARAEAAPGRRPEAIKTRMA